LISEVFVKTKNTVKPVVVTGCHRSGSTWIGNVLANSPSVSYIHEPFNGMCSPGKCNVIFPYTYMHISEENQGDFYTALSDTFHFRYNIGAELSTVRSLRDFARLTRDSTIFLKNKTLGIAPLLKDPMAVLSAEWLANCFEVNILISVRHPAAFVSSCKQLNWSFNFDNFLNQPLLMKKYFAPFESEIIDYAKYDHPLIDKLILVWKLIYWVVADYRSHHPEWIILRYEDICHDPLNQFQTIFKAFDLEFTPNVQSFIQDSTTYQQFKGVFQEIHSVKRDSQKYSDIWKKRLSETEIDYIRNRVEDVSKLFYTDADWHTASTICEVH
jgi:hypothetical protein